MSRYKYLIAVILISAFAYAFYSLKVKGSNAITSLRVISEMPMVINDDSSEDFFNIYYRGDMVLYEFYYGSNIHRNDSLIENKKLNYFFLHKKGSNVGYQYDPHGKIGNEILGVDSTLKKFALQDFRWHIMAEKKPVFSKRDAGNVLKEMYTGPNKFNKTLNDTIVYYYSNDFKEFDFSLSAKLDSIKGAKLFKVRLLYPEVRGVEHGIIFPKSEISFEIKANDVENPEKIRSYFDTLSKELLKIETNPPTVVTTSAKK